MRSILPNSGQSVANTGFYAKRVAAILGVAAILLCAHIYAPMAHGGPVICAMHGLFGLPCPGCGMTRAFCALAQADLAAAVRHNALSIPVVLSLLAVTVIAAYEISVGRRTRMHRLLFSHRVAWSWAAVVIAYHASRCIVWLFSGYLVNGYVKTSWTYHLLFRG
jgi:hypothetical protein